MNLQPIPNLRKIAKIARVSHSTVSMALRNHPRISEPTRKRILVLAEKMGYRSNPLVATLMSHIRSNRTIVAQEPVAFLTSGPTENWWRAYHGIVANFTGATARAEQLGFRLEPFWMGPDGQGAAAVSKVLTARAFRGAILAPRPMVPNQDIPFDWARYAITTIGYSFTQVPMHRAAHDHMRSMIELYGALRKLRYRRIGLAMDSDNMLRVKYNWLAGLLTGQELYGGTRLPALRYEQLPGKKQFLAWYKEQRPDVVVCLGHDISGWMQEAGYRIPRDVGYAYLNLSEAAAEQKMAGVRQQSAAIGAAAFDLLASQIYHSEIGPPQTPKCILIDGFLSLGETAPGRPGK